MRSYNHEDYGKLNLYSCSQHLEDGHMAGHKHVGDHYKKKLYP